MEEQQKELSKILGITRKSDGAYSSKQEPASWAEIYTEIGRLKERAEKSAEIRYLPSNEPMPLNSYQEPFKCMCGNPVPHSYCAYCKSN